MTEELESESKEEKLYRETRVQGCTLKCEWNAKAGEYILWFSEIPFHDRATVRLGTKREEAERYFRTAEDALRTGNPADHVADIIFRMRKTMRQH